jgi:hypothetical protein
VITTAISISHKAILILRTRTLSKFPTNAGFSTSDLDLHVWKPPLVGNLRDKDSSVINFSRQ